MASSTYSSQNIQYGLCDNIVHLDCVSYSAAVRWEYAECRIVRMVKHQNFEGKCHVESWYE